MSYKRMSKRNNFEFSSRFAYYSVCLMEPFRVCSTRESMSMNREGEQVRGREGVREKKKRERGRDEEGD